MTKNFLTPHQQNEFEIKLAPELKFELIGQTIETYGLKRMVRYLCEVLEVSRSGYYNYFKEESLQKER